MNEMKKEYITPQAGPIGIPRTLPSLLATASTIASALEGDWIEFGEIEEAGEWGH